MIEADYRHVLFKDLKNYLSKRDYLSGFTPTEQAWIRKNIGAASADAVDAIKGKAISVTYDELENKIENESLVVGAVYLITDFQTIYQSKTLNSEGKYVTFGSDIHPSKVYKIAAIAITSSSLLSTVSIISDDPTSIFWSVQYDVTKETLDDGKTTKGRITYLSDNNFNQARFDFKNVLIESGSRFYHALSDKDGNDNSDQCFNNNLCFASDIILVGNCSNNCIYGNNVKFLVPVSNLTGELNDVYVYKDDIKLSNETAKTTILYNGVYYIDYLDLETLTHQFYAISNNIHVS